VKFGIIYLLTGTAHASRLVVSVHSLRKFYGGPVTIFYTRADSHAVARRLADDRRLDVEIAEFRESEGGINSSYLTKPRLMLTASPYEATVFLDADTLIAADIEPLLAATRNHSLVVTEFCGWSSLHPAVERRLRKWMPLIHTPGDSHGMRQMLTVNLEFGVPAINCGVMGFHRDTPFLHEWPVLAELGKETLLPDEIAMQLLLVKHSHRVLSSRFNYSLPFGGPPPYPVSIWHFCASLHLSHDLNRGLWLPAYEECVRQKLAGIDEWSRSETLDAEPPPLGIPGVQGPSHGRVDDFLGG
jgi:hypothetical protein